MAHGLRRATLKQLTIVTDRMCSKKTLTAQLRSVRPLHTFGEQTWDNNTSAKLESAPCLGGIL